VWVSRPTLLNRAIPFFVLRDFVSSQCSCLPLAETDASTPSPKKSPLPAAISNVQPFLNKGFVFIL
jgi:hypothetical protein